jgi:hypothetical protein
MFFELGMGELVGIIPNYGIDVKIAIPEEWLLVRLPKSNLICYSVQNFGSACFSFAVSLHSNIIIF